MNQEQQKRHFHIIRALQHLNAAGLGELSVIDVVATLATVGLGDPRLTSVLVENMVAYEKTCTYGNDEIETLVFPEAEADTAAGADTSSEESPEISADESPNDSSEDGGENIHQGVDTQ